jgi:hypothetical protein
MAKIWDFLADHGPHVRHWMKTLAISVRWKESRSRVASAMNLIDNVLPWVVFLLGLSVPMLAITVLS